MTRTPQQWVARALADPATAPEAVSAWQGHLGELASLRAQRTGTATTTREKLVRLVDRYPDATVTEYADALKVSRARVYQLLAKIGVRTRAARRTVAK